MHLQNDAWFESIETPMFYPGSTSVSKHCRAGPDGAVAMSSANMLVDTGFTSRYRLQSSINLLRLQSK